MFLVIFIVCAVIAALWQSTHKDIRKKPPSLNKPGYIMIYTDQKGNFDKEKIVVSEMLVSKKHDIRGKPDYIFMNKRKNDLMPVELKSGKIGQRAFPHKGDFMQLIAYFVILEEVFGLEPKEGRIIYKDYMFIVNNIKSHRDEFFNILSDMRSMLKTGEGKANASFVSCRHCICNGTVCEFCKNTERAKEKV
ncbi:MAG: hypothetical protein LBV08_11280 [Clostridiales bacterium]|jgi:CRISPR-associated exonuclease Cas4|nr:hypothetical protein [Clostridiales bacterium]